MLPISGTSTLFESLFIEIWKKNSHHQKYVIGNIYRLPVYVADSDGTKPIPSTRSIGYRVNFKVSVSPKNPIPIPSTFRYNFDTFSILYMHVYYKIKLHCTIALSITVRYDIQQNKLFHK